MSQGKWKKKSSVIWLTPVEIFREVVISSKTLAEVMRRLGVQAQAGNYKTIKTRLKKEGIDTSHLPIGRCDYNKGRTIIIEKIPLDKILVEHSSYNRTCLKKRLLESGLLRNECCVCGQGPEWFSKPLVLVLDHINGVSDDNRLLNLRMLCPNCNAQQPTFCGRHVWRSNRKVRNHCTDCQKELDRGTKGSLCFVCLSNGESNGISSEGRRNGQKEYDNNRSN